MNLGQLLPGVSLVDAYASRAVLGLQLDSRAVGEGDVFVALPGATFDGRDYIDVAVAAGAVAVVADADTAAVEEQQNTAGQSVPVIKIPDLAPQLSAIAGHFYGHPADELAVIGITGTNGKTTCSQLFAQLMVLLGERAGVVGTLGCGLKGETLTDTGFTTPDGLSSQRILRELSDQGAQTVAMEVSSHSLIQGRVAAVTIESALFTNLSRDHLDYHGSMAAYAAAKQQLLQQPGLKRAVINLDDPWSAELLAALPATVSPVTYSVRDTGADVSVRNLTSSPTGFEAELVTAAGKGQLHCNLLGEFNLSNLLGVIAVALSRGVALKQILALVPQLAPVTGRMQVIAGATSGEDDIQVVVDYAHTPDALEKTLQALRQHVGGRLCCVFGCGGDRDRGKRPEMAVAAESGADYLVLTSDNPRTESPQQIINDTLAGLARPENCLVVENRAQAIAQAIAEAAPGDTILLAGKGHEDYQIIGREKLPFSDIEEAATALGRRGLAL